MTTNIFSFSDLVREFLRSPASINLYKVIPISFDFTQYIQGYRNDAAEIESISVYNNIHGRMSDNDEHNVLLCVSRIGKPLVSMRLDSSILEKIINNEAVETLDITDINQFIKDRFSSKKHLVVCCSLLSRRDVLLVFSATLRKMGKQICGPVTACPALHEMVSFKVHEYREKYSDFGDSNIHCTIIVQEGDSFYNANYEICITYSLGPRDYQSGHPSMVMPYIHRDFSCESSPLRSTLEKHVFRHKKHLCVISVTDLEKRSSIFMTKFKNWSFFYGDLCEDVGRQIDYLENDDYYGNWWSAGYHTCYTTTTKIDLSSIRSPNERAHRNYG